MIDVNDHIALWWIIYNNYEDLMSGWRWVIKRVPKIISSSFCSSSCCLLISSTQLQLLCWQFRWWRHVQSALWTFKSHSNPICRKLCLSFAFFHDHQAVICDLENELMDLGQIFEGKSWLGGIFDKNFHSFVGKLLPAMNVGIAFRNFINWLNIVSS